MYALGLICWEIAMRTDTGEGGCKYVSMRVRVRVMVRVCVCVIGVGVVNWMSETVDDVVVMVMACVSFEGSLQEAMKLSSNEFLIFKKCAQTHVHK